MSVSLYYLVRTGRFNWANESEASTNIHLSIMRENEKLATVNLNFDENDYGYWKDVFEDHIVEAAEEALTQYEKRIWLDSRKEERAKFKKLFRENVNEIEQNHLQKQIEDTERKVQRAQEKLTSLQTDLFRLRKYPRKDDSELPFPEAKEAKP